MGFRPDLKSTLRAVRLLRRRLRYGIRAAGAALVVAVVVQAIGGGVSAGPIVLFVCGLVVFVEADVALWLSVRRHRDVIVEPVEITVSDTGISRRTATTSLDIPWDRLSQVITRDDLWIFMANRVQVITLYKSRLTPEQVNQVSAFLDARTVQR